MVALENDILVLDRTQDADAILPLNHPGKGGRDAAWFIDIGIESQQILHWLIDAEIMTEAVAIRYINLQGQQFEGQAFIEELISGGDSDMCRLRGKGKPPTAFLADEPKLI